MLDDPAEWPVGIIHKRYNYQSGLLHPIIAVNVGPKILRLKFFYRDQSNAFCTIERMKVFSLLHVMVNVKI